MPDGPSTPEQVVTSPQKTTELSFQKTSSPIEGQLRNNAIQDRLSKWFQIKSSPAEGNNQQPTDSREELKIIAGVSKPEPQVVKEVDQPQTPTLESEATPTNSTPISPEVKTDSTEEKQHATPDPIELTAEQQQLLDELKARHPDNPLFNNDFKEVPENYVSVFSIGSDNGIVRAAQNGLGYEADQSKVDSFDKLFDELAPEGFKRNGAVFAYPSLSEATSTEPANTTFNAFIGGGKNILMEIKVDPKRVRVASMSEYDDKYSKGAYWRDPEVTERQKNNIRESVKQYWEDSITLEEYSQMSPEDRVYFGYPEVIIPFSVEPDYIRIVSVLPKTEK